MLLATYAGRVALRELFVLSDLSTADGERPSVRLDRPQLRLCITPTSCYVRVRSPNPKSVWRLLAKPDDHFSGRERLTLGRKLLPLAGGLKDSFPLFPPGTCHSAFGPLVVAGTCLNVRQFLASNSGVGNDGSVSATWPSARCYPAFGPTPEQSSRNAPCPWLAQLRYQLQGVGDSQ